MPGLKGGKHQNCKGNGKSMWALFSNLPKVDALDSSVVKSNSAGSERVRESTVWPRGIVHPTCMLCFY